jgi:hypothetical protein
MKTLNLVGQRFGKLNVLERRPSTCGVSRWLCRCECGTEKEFFAGALKSGKATTCGCKWFEDLVGVRFGLLVVNARAKTSGKGCTWLCRCDCGNDYVARARYLKRGYVKSCGCLRAARAGKSRVVQPGAKFGRLTAIEHVGFKGRHALFKFKCDCGSEKVISANSVRNGDVRSCGCWRREQVLAARRFLPGHDGKAALRFLYKNCSIGARRRGIVFSIGLDLFGRLVKAPCSYCGQPPEVCPRKRYADYMNNGIDRIDSTKGYSVDNVCTACSRCNTAKSTMTREEFLTWVTRVARHNLLAL